MVNSKLLKSKMVLHDDTMETLTAALGISKPSLSAKINNKSDFKQSEIKFFIERYELTAEEVLEIFFN